ncbi:MAG TPA: bifunctional prephenate dehydrogenase/3-phosphoshikimate 1-carboxyvinyltransferase, partial [Cellvibrionaceae bacterium]
SRALMPEDEGIDTDYLVSPGGHLCGSICVPGELSSAVFFMMAAAITPDSDLTLSQVSFNPTRAGVISFLQLMGADVTTSAERILNAEPVADIRVRYARLKGCDIPEEVMACVIDEFPMLCVAAACAQGKTHLTGALQRNRIEAMAKGLQAVGVVAEPLPDGIVITGGTLTGGEVDSFNDHRIAMAFVLAGIRAVDPIRIKCFDSVAPAFGDFVALTKQMGISLEVINHY